MIKIAFFLILIVGVVGAALRFHLIPTSKLHLPTISLKKSATQPTAKNLDDVLHPSAADNPQPQSQTGKIAGISTEKIGGVGQSLVSAVSSLVTTNGDNPQVTIDVQKISDQIGAQMEKLPASIVAQAKVAYCQQVLIEATKSGEKK